MELYCRSVDRITPGFEAAFNFLQTQDFDRDAAELLWRTRHKKVVRMEVPAEYAVDGRSDFQVVWKHYGEKRFFRYLFRPSLALREWKGFETAGSCGIPVARVLAAGEKRRGLRLVSSYFMTEMVCGSGDGDDFLPGGAREQDEALAAEFAEKNLKLLAKLHRSGAVHGGFTPRNELYVLTGSEERGQRLDVVWIDLATCRKVPFFKRKRLQNKDLDYFLSPWRFAPERREELYEIYLEELKKNG